MTRIRKGFRKATVNIIAYRGQPAGYFEDEILLSAGQIMHVSAGDDEIRQLKGEPTRAVLFMMGDCWYWVTRKDFDLFTVEVDPAQRT